MVQGQGVLVVGLECRQNILINISLFNVQWLLKGISLFLNKINRSHSISVGKDIKI